MAKLGGVAATVDVVCSNNGGTADGQIRFAEIVFSGSATRVRAVGLITPQQPPSADLSHVPLLGKVKWVNGRIVVTESWYERPDLLRLRARDHNLGLPRRRADRCPYGCLEATDRVMLGLRTMQFVASDNESVSDAQAGQALAPVFEALARSRRRWIREVAATLARLRCHRRQAASKPLRRLAAASGSLSAAIATAMDGLSGAQRLRQRRHRPATRP